MIRTAEAPSVSGDELPGVISQSISGNRAASSSVRNEGRSAASVAAVVPARTVSSALTGPAGVAGDVARLLAHLLGAAGDDVLH
jgi:hypothetical protein